MKTIIEVLKEVTAMLTPDTDFRNALPSFQNLEIDLEDFPVVYCVEPIESEHEITASKNLTETYPLVLMFLDNSALEDTQSQHDVVIYIQRAQAKKFIQHLSNYRETADANLFIKSITSIKMTNVINVLDHNLSGVQVEMDVEMYEQDKLC